LCKRRLHNCLDFAQSVLCYERYGWSMKSIAHRELRNRSADVLRSVQAGESFEVTNNGEVVAMLTPPNFTAMLRARFRPPLTRGGFSTLPRVSSPETVQDVIDDLRAER
jgi:prevent-host-death family protein